MLIAHSHILLDGHCVLNFCASGKFLNILRYIPTKVVITKVVKDYELKTLQRLQNEENEGLIQFEIAILEGLLTVVDFESEEEIRSFANYTATLGDDGESATCAIAFHRGWGIATDDKAAISFIQQTAPYIQVISALEIIRYWSEAVNIDPSRLRDVLQAIQSEGGYSPPNDHSLRSWWDAAANN